MTITAEPATLAEFWAHARGDIQDAPVEAPEAWAFGATAAHADGLLDLVLSGTKTATASSAWDYAAEQEPRPQAGDLSIILDGRGQPRAVIRTTSVVDVRFDEVSAEHAFAEGEGDRTLEAWRDIHTRFWGEHSANPRGVTGDLMVLCENFVLVHPRPHSGSGVSSATQ